MYLYLFEIDSVKNYGWEQIVPNRNLFYKKGFKIKDLDSAKWFIRLSKAL